MDTADLPQRPGARVCSYYVKHGKCGYGARCKFDHPAKFHGKSASQGTPAQHSPRKSKDTHNPRDTDSHKEHTPDVEGVQNGRWKPGQKTTVGKKISSLLNDMGESLDECDDGIHEAFDSILHSTKRTHTSVQDVSESIHQVYKRAYLSLMKKMYLWQEDLALILALVENEPCSTSANGSTPTFSSGRQPNTRAKDQQMEHDMFEVDRIFEQASSSRVHTSASSNGANGMHHEAEAGHSVNVDKSGPTANGDKSSKNEEAGQKVQSASAEVAAAVAAAHAAVKDWATSFSRDTPSQPSPTHAESQSFVFGAGGSKPQASSTPTPVFSTRSKTANEQSPSPSHRPHLSQSDHEALKQPAFVFSAMPTAEPAAASSAANAATSAPVGAPATSVSPTQAPAQPAAFSHVNKKPGQEAAPVNKKQGQEAVPVNKKQGQEQGQEAAPANKKQGQEAAPANKKQGQEAAPANKKEGQEAAPANKKEGQEAAPANKKQAQGSIPAKHATPSAQPATNQNTKQKSVPKSGDSKTPDAPMAASSDKQPATKPVGVAAKAAAPVKRTVLSPLAVGFAKSSSLSLKSRANDCYKRRNFLSAETHYGMAIKELEKLGPVAGCLDQHQDVLVDLSVLYSNRAGARLMRGQVQQALEDCIKSFELDPTFSRAYVRACTCCIRLGKLGEAEQHLQQGMQQAGAVKDKRKEIQAKMKELADLVVQRQKLLDALHQSITIEQLQKLQEDSAAAFEEMRDCAVLKDVRTLLELRAGLFPKVLAACSGEQAAEQHASWEWWLELQVKYHEGSLDDAIKLAEQGRTLLAAHHADTNSHSTQHTRPCRLPTVAELESTIQNMKDMVAFKQQGNDAVGAQRWQEAVNKYTAALALKPPLPFSAVLHCNRSLAHHNLKNLVDATADAARAKALNPKYAKAYQRLSTMLSAMKRSAVAVATLTTMLDQCSLDITERVKANTRLADVRWESSRQKTPDHYKFLELTKQCSENDIRTAYKRMALRYHPDKALSSCKFGLQLGECGIHLAVGADVERRIREEASSLFSFIGQAHEELSDKTKRRKVDMLLDNDDDDFNFSRSSYSHSSSRMPSYYNEYSPCGHYASRTSSNSWWAYDDPNDDDDDDDEYETDDGEDEAPRAYSYHTGPMRW